MLRSGPSRIEAVKSAHMVRSRLPKPEFSALLDAAPDAMVIIDRAGRIVQVNEQTARLFGFTREQMIGSPVEMLIPERFRGVHPGHRDAYFAHPRARPMGHLGRELFGRRADGREFPAEVSLSPLRLDGEDLVIAAIRDGTERRAIEERFRRLLEAAPDAMVIVGPDGAIAHVNDQAVTLFGYSRDELIGRQVEMLIPERYRAAHPNHRGRYFQEPRTRAMGHGGLQLFGRRRDGSEFPAEISLSPLVTDEGMVAITAVRDITDRRRLEEERRRLGQAEEAVRLRDEFISVASHELKTPLSAIQMQVDTISRSSERFDGHEFKQRTMIKLHQLTKAVQRMATLTDQLLDISRITGGRLSLEYHEVDLAQLVRGIVAPFEDELARVGSPLVLEVLPELRATVDPLRLEQVLANLLSNAIKYGPGKPIEIRLRAESERAMLTVRDHGIGIAPEHQSRVFDKFERAVSHRQYGGFGLGLWISRQLIEAHHGSISVESQPGAGSTFTVAVPLRPERSGVALAASPERSHRVLLVDDDNDLRETYADALRDEGIEVVEAVNGQHALEQLAAGPRPDVIVLDLMMPVMDGLTFRSEQQRQAPLAQVPVVVMSAAVDGEQQARRMGCEFLRKPATLRALLDAVTRHGQQRAHT
jgi:PAS domain S-box-containing protein